MSNTTETPAGCRPASTQPSLPEVDCQGPGESAYVHRGPEPIPDLPPLPTDPAARRRVIASRGW